MSNDTVIHVKVDYADALSSKRDILSSEMNLVQMKGIIERYQTLRASEIVLRQKLYKKMKEARSSIKSIERIFPKVDFKKLEPKEPQAPKSKKKVTQKKNAPKKNSNDVESQLQEIQRRLNDLQSGNLYS